CPCSERGRLPGKTWPTQPLPWHCWTVSTATRPAAPPRPPRYGPDLRGTITMPDAVGFYTDTTVCIGCKACQVACHQWNALPAEHGPGGRMSLPVLSGHSYDNTRSLSDVNWRHV